MDGAAGMPGGQWAVNSSGRLGAKAHLAADHAKDRAMAPGGPVLGTKRSVSPLARGLARPSQCAGIRSPVLDQDSG